MRAAVARGVQFRRVGMATIDAQPRFADERRFPRIGAEILAVVYDHQARHYCQVRDLSEGGMRLAGAEVSQEATYVDVDLHLPDSLAPMRVVARRVHRRTGGWGLRFVKLPPGGATRLGRFVKSQLAYSRLVDQRGDVAIHLEETAPSAKALGSSAAAKVNGALAHDHTEKQEIAAAPPIPVPPRPKVSEPSAGRSRPALPVPKDAVAPPSSIVRPPPVGAGAPSVRVATPIAPPRAGAAPSAAPSVRSALYSPSAGTVARPPRPAPPPLRTALPPPAPGGSALLAAAAGPSALPPPAAARSALPPPAPARSALPPPAPKSDRGSGPRLHAQEIAARRTAPPPLPGPRIP